MPCAPLSPSLLHFSQCELWTTASMVLYCHYCHCAGAVRSLCSIYKKKKRRGTNADRFFAVREKSWLLNGDNDRAKWKRRSDKMKYKREQLKLICTLCSSILRQPQCWLCIIKWHYRSFLQLKAYFESRRRRRRQPFKIRWEYFEFWFMYDSYR